MMTTLEQKWRCNLNSNRKYALDERYSGLHRTMTQDRLWLRNGLGRLLDQYAGRTIRIHISRPNVCRRIKGKPRRRGTRPPEDTSHVHPKIGHACKF